MKLTNPVLAGSSILVFVTEANAGNTGLPITITDTSGNVYTKLDQVDDKTNAAWQSLFSFVAYDVHPGTTTLTIKFQQVEWQGVLAVEVGGVTSLPTIEHKGNVQYGTGTGINAVTSGLLTAGTSPGVLIGLSTPTLDTKGAPNAGTGFTSVVTVWNWLGEEGSATVPSSRLEYQHYTDPSNDAATFAATFTALGSGDDWDTLAVFFPDAP